MKQKYMILKNEENGNLIIREFAELEKEAFTFICEETYDSRDIESAIAQGKTTLISTLRTQNLFPISIYAEKIAEAVININESENAQPVELLFDDKDLLIKDKQKPVIEDDIESEPDEIDELLDVDILKEDEDLEELKNIKSPLKVDDDDLIKPE